MAHPNQLLPWDQAIFQQVGGDPNIHYLHAYWELAADEAWIIETPVPTCRFWNFVLQNWWMESGDYRHIPEAWTNGAKAGLEPDGRLVIVVAADNPRCRELDQYDVASQRYCSVPVDRSRGASVTDLPRRQMPGRPGPFALTRRGV